MEASKKFVQKVILYMIYEQDRSSKALQGGGAYLKNLVEEGN